MEKLKELLSCLNDNSSVKEIEDTFSKIADILLFESYIKTSNGNYRMLEIEFYFMNKNHEDKVTIKRHENGKEGMWWLHNFGVDLSFKCKTGKFYGGILIRSIVPFKDNGNQIDNTKVICGPGKCCWELFYSSALENHIVPQIVVNNGAIRHSGEMGITKRHITGKTKGVDGNYRFYVKGLNLAIESGYSASPWK